MCHISILSCQAQVLRNPPVHLSPRPRTRSTRVSEAAAPPGRAGPGLGRAARRGEGVAEEQNAARGILSRPGAAAVPGRAFDRAAPSPVAVCPPQPHRVPAPVQESRPSFPSPRRGPTELKKAKKKREARSAVAEAGGQGRAYLPGNRGGGRAPAGRRALPRGPGPAAGGGAAAVPAG